MWFYLYMEFYLHMWFYYTCNFIYLHDFIYLHMRLYLCLWFYLHMWFYLYMWFHLFLCVILALLGPCCCVGSSRVVAGGGCSLLQCSAFSSSWVEHRRRGAWASELYSTGSVVVALRPGGSAACGILPAQRSILCLLWQVGSFISSFEHYHLM